MIDYFSRPNLIVNIMGFDLKEIFTATMVLFAVIDIIGNVPIILDLRKKAGLKAYDRIKRS